MRSVADPWTLIPNSPPQRTTLGNLKATIERGSLGRFFCPPTPTLPSSFIRFYYICTRFNSWKVCFMHIKRLTLSISESRKWAVRTPHYALLAWPCGIAGMERIVASPKSAGAAIVAISQESFQFPPTSGVSQPLLRLWSAASFLRLLSLRFFGCWGMWGCRLFVGDPGLRRLLNRVRGRLPLRSAQRKARRHEIDFYFVFDSVHIVLGHYRT